MKRIILFSSILFITSYLFAQQEPKPITRTIEVTGSAEMEIEPDEVYVSVTLREYMKEKTKIRLEEIDKEFKKSLAALKIDLANVAVEGANAYYNYDWYKNESHKTDFLASKTYIIKLPNLEQYNELMKKLDSKGIENAWLQRTEHSKMEEYRQQVKVNALKAAKLKAKLLVESIGSQLGEVVFIREMNAGNQYPQPMYKTMSNMAMEADASAVGGADPIGMQKIKVRYEVEAHFFIK